MADDLDLAPADPTTLQAASAREAELRRIRALTADFARCAQPRAVLLTLEPWTMENALPTSTLKPKRNNLPAHFAVQIERIYGG